MLCGLQSFKCHHTQGPLPNANNWRAPWRIGSCLLVLKVGHATRISSNQNGERRHSQDGIMNPPRPLQVQSHVVRALQHTINVSDHHEWPSTSFFLEIYCNVFRWYSDLYRGAIFASLFQMCFCEKSTTLPRPHRVCKRRCYEPVWNPSYAWLACSLFSL